MATNEIKNLALQLAANNKVITELLELANRGAFLPQEEVIINSERLTLASQEYLEGLRLKGKEFNAQLQELHKINDRIANELGEYEMEEQDETGGSMTDEISETGENEAFKDPNISLEDFFSELSDEIDDILKRKCIHLRLLDKGCIEPVRVGDLLKVEKELWGYEMGEIAQIENVMASEKREYSVRDLNRITDYSESYQEKEKEESESSTIDERFQLDTQVQKAQQQSINVGASVSGNYNFPNGSVGINTSASYSNAKQSSHNSSKEYAKQITEEATKRVKEHIREVKKVTIVTEQVRTSVHGFDNTAGEGGAGGSEHITGIYRWVDKVYNAQLYDYGKRLFLEFFVPEPAFFLRNIRSKIEEEEHAGLHEPLAPDKYYLKFPEGSFQRTMFLLNGPTSLYESNYEELCTYYGVKDYDLMPPEFIYRSKGFSIPETMEPQNLNVERDKKDLSLARKLDMDLDRGYQLTKIGAFIPDDKEVTAVALRLVNTERLGQSKGSGSVQVLVGHQTFTFMVSVTKPNETENNHPFWRTFALIATAGLSEHLTNAMSSLSMVLNGSPLNMFITHDFNTMRSLGRVPGTNEFDARKWVGETNSSKVPITILCDFEGLFIFNVVYEAERTEEIYKEWQKNTYAKIMEGYERKYQEYLQRKREADLKKNGRVEQLELKPRESKYREIESTELKKHCITLLTKNTAFIHPPNLLYYQQMGYHFINTNAPSPNMPNWQANHVNGVTAGFFEDSFEWEQISYQFYPYYWGDLPRWKDLYQENETGDDTFDQFLKAGYAKVVVPIRPHYEKAVLFYLKTNRIWRGGELPAINDLKFLSYLEELHASKQLAKGAGDKIGETWQIRLPTSFVILQQDGQLPVDMYAEEEDFAQEPELTERVLDAIRDETVKMIKGIGAEPDIAG